MPIHHIAKAAHWLLQQAGVALFGVMKQRLVDNMGLNSRTMTTPNTPVLLDEYLHRFEERLAQRIIDRLDEDRLVKLNSSITQLKTAAKMTAQTPLKQGHLLNVVGNFFDIANLPEPGTTAGFPNAQLRYLAFLGSQRCI